MLKRGYGKGRPTPEMERASVSWVKTKEQVTQVTDTPTMSMAT